MTLEPENHEQLDEAVRTRQERRARWQREGERSLGQNLAMIGALGWTIVMPTLIGIFAGRWLDRHSIWGFSGPWACSWPASRSDARWPGKGSIANDPRAFDPCLYDNDGVGRLCSASSICGLTANRDSVCRGRGWFVPLALTLGRIGAAVIVLGLAAKLGAASLLATFLGFFLARIVALRAARRAG